MRLVALVSFWVALVTMLVEMSRSIRAQAQDTCKGKFVVRTFPGSRATGPYSIGSIRCEGGCAASGGQCNPKDLRGTPPVKACFCKSPTGFGGCLLISGPNRAGLIDFDCVTIGCAKPCEKTEPETETNPNPRITQTSQGCVCPK